MRVHKYVRVSVLVFSAIALSSRLEAQQENREVQQAESFIQSVARTIYSFAWPTATYKSVRFGGVDRDGNNLIIQAVFAGEGMLGDTCWVKLGVVVNNQGIQDIRVMDHHELFLGPFEASKAVRDLLLELEKENSQPLRPAARSTPAVSATCLINATGSALKFQYRWGDTDWKKHELPMDNSVTLSWNTDVGGPAPALRIRYDDDFVEGYTEQRYQLDNVMTGASPACQQSKQYVFTTAGSKINLNLADGSL